MTELTEEERQELAEAHADVMKAEAQLADARDTFADLVVSARDRGASRRAVATAAGCSETAVHTATLRGWAL